MGVCKRRLGQIGNELINLIRCKSVKITIAATGYRSSRRAPTKILLKTRESCGAYNNQTTATLTYGTNIDYRRQFGMNKEEFRALYFHVAKDLQTKPKGKRNTEITAREKLALTLNYLKSGATMGYIANQFVTSHSAVNSTIKKVSKAIVECLENFADVRPKTTQCWEKVAARFFDRWQLPNCLGALDGKHIEIEKFGKTGSTTINYKKYPSVVLLAVCDADYRVIHFNVGAHGGRSDGGIWREDRLGHGLATGILKDWIPPPKCLPGDDEERLGKVNCFIVADDAFRLGSHVIKPYSLKQMSKLRRITNYRISRARIAIECVFGHLTRRFHILLRMPTNEEMTNLIIKCCVHLHNFIRTLRLDNKRELELIENPPTFCFGKELKPDPEIAEFEEKECAGGGKETEKAGTDQKEGDEHDENQLNNVNESSNDETGNDKEETEESGGGEDSVEEKIDESGEREDNSEEEIDDTGGGENNDQEEVDIEDDEENGHITRAKIHYYVNFIHVMKKKPKRSNKQDYY